MSPSLGQTKGAEKEPEKGKRQALRGLNRPPSPFGESATGRLRLAHAHLLRRHRRGEVPLRLGGFRLSRDQAAWRRRAANGL